MSLYGIAVADNFFDTSSHKKLIITLPLRLPRCFMLQA